MGIQYHCKNQRRRTAVLTKKGADGNPVLNGIDYLEVSSADQKELTVHFIHNLPGQENAVPPSPAPALTQENVVIEGGVRVKDVRVVKFESYSNNILTLTVNTRGDFSTYTLRLVTSPTESAPPKGFDPILSCIEFSFKIECPGDFDCLVEQKCPPERTVEPVIDYLAKDYASFRQLVLDRLSLIMPDWEERNPADMSIALVELLAYAGDRLSYYQDAVTTEAYLNTARKRVSLRRHSRLLDYPMHDGCNSRVWVCFEVADAVDVVHLKREDDTKRVTRLLTRCMEQTLIDYAEWEKEVDATHPEIFELLHDVRLYPAHNRISFYTWEDELCCLPKGATSATLCDDPENRLRLRAGDVLILEERLGAATGEEADADPAHRHAVRLTHVHPEAKIENNNRIPDDLRRDPLTGQGIVEIEWHSEDALPFPLCISARVKGKVKTDMASARGNVVLADHGRTYEDEALLPEVVPETGGYRPHLSRTGITFCTSYDHDDAEKAPASSVMAQEPGEALPAVELTDDIDSWSAQRDLLSSDRFAPEFVVEMEEDGRVRLRFGDDVLGRKPGSGTTLKATYRVGNGGAGNGGAGNVGAGAIAHIVPVGSDTDRITRVWNPLPAQGGTDAERIEQVRLYAPQAFRIQERAVTEADYAEVVQRHSEVQKAVATLRWTGSWYTLFITVDRRGGREVDDRFKDELRDFIERFRMAGHDVEIDAPRFVPLDIAFTVCVAPGYLRSDVKQALLELFSTTDLPDGQRGFFHPDNYTFGQPVYLSQIVAAAMEVPGVLWIDTSEKPPHRFKRWGQPSRKELEEGMITFDRLEIVRLDNDPNFPENGKIEFFMKGGL
jgi:hypothetical protein